MQKLEYAEEAMAESLPWGAVDHLPTNRKGEKELLFKVPSFMSKLKWAPMKKAEHGRFSREAQNEEHQGVTWMGLLAIYERHGGYQPIYETREWAIITKIRAQNRSRQDSMKLKRLQASLRAKKQSTSVRTKEFKRVVRRVCATLPEDYEAWLRSAPSPINRLAAVACEHWQPAIRARPYLSQEDQRNTQEAVMCHLGHSKKVRAQAWTGTPMNMKKASGKSFIPRRHQEFVGDDWTRSPIIQNGIRKTGIMHCLCPRCGRGRMMPPRLRTRRGAWSILKCGHCSTKTAVGDWRCRCHK